jgi:hypothetical protein
MGSPTSAALAARHAAPSEVRRLAYRGYEAAQFRLALARRGDDLAPILRRAAECTTALAAFEAADEAWRAASGVRS